MQHQYLWKHLQEVRLAEEAAITAELAFDENPTECTLEVWSKSKAKLLLATNKEVEYWREKANIHWMDKGDSNSKFFHSYVKGRNSKLTIKHIKAKDGRVLSLQQDIQREAIQHFTETFSKSSIEGLQNILQFILSVITEEDNHALSCLPIIEEVRNSIWDLDPHSTSGPDGYTGEIFNKTWGILGSDILKVAQEFSLGIPTPKAYDATLITLIPKSNTPKSFNDFRPISLFTFVSKIHSKHLANRLKGMLHKLISPHVVNLLLANLKATSFSILINGHPVGFFPMERGIKQGEPLSPILYILAMEGFTRTINHYISISFLCPFNEGKENSRKNTAASYLPILIVSSTPGITRSSILWGDLLDNVLSFKGVALKASSSKYVETSGSGESDILELFNHFLQNELEQLNESTKPTCYGCGERGHIKGHCPKRKFKKSKCRKQSNSSSSSSSDDEVAICLMAQSESEEGGPDQKVEGFRANGRGYLLKLSHGTPDGNPYAVTDSVMDSLLIKFMISFLARTSVERVLGNHLVNCYMTVEECKEVGHFRNQCVDDKQVNIAEGSVSDEEVLLTCCVDNNVDPWVMDSGASFHSTHSGEAL
ncbi:unnamed protein product [Cuscuta campestris]|uniref:CCHC-type domain-containing protein n=1 Tax=Cuscuta campestris TaxID=132261 RepID=A0A484L4N2_9ASTE|nr:unnamed protein product [Cuscuta campestris]